MPLKDSKRCWRTASIAPSTPRVFRVTRSNTSTTSRTMASISWEGTPRRDTVYGAGGSSCIISMFASASQTAVSWRCAAPHTSSSRGAGGNDSSVASAESAVIDLKRSLSAYRYLAQNHSHARTQKAKCERTSLIAASVDQNSTAP